MARWFALPALLLSLYGCGRSELAQLLERHGECRNQWDIECLQAHYAPPLWDAAGMRSSKEEARQMGVEAAGVSFSNLYERGDWATVTMIASARLQETGKVYSLRLNQEWRRTSGRWLLVHEEPAGMR